MWFKTPEITFSFREAGSTTIHAVLQKLGSGMALSVSF